jgi:probable DNA repair protein
MGSRTEEIDGFLRDGGLVVTSSDRAARALQGAYHRQRRAEGFSAWTMPKIADWKVFVRSAWEDLGADERLLMNSAQEQALWMEIIRDERHLPTALDASVRRLAALAMDAHELLCFYSPRHLYATARTAWDQDAGTFSHWLIAFDEACKGNNLLSASRVPCELIPKLQAQASPRAPLAAEGFDRMLPVQRELFDAWGTWQQFPSQVEASQLSFHSAPDSQTELNACAYWCNRQIAANPEARLLVIAQQIASRRGELERAFLHFCDHAPNFEFSLGIPLTQVPLARGTHLLLRWLHSALEENEVDWLISSRLAATPGESASLEAWMRVLRHKGLHRTRWTLQALLDQPVTSSKLPQTWTQRMIAAQRRLRDSGGRLRSPLEWADAVPHLLEMMGWPGERAQDSASFQAQRRFQHALDSAGSLGFNGRRVDWAEFLSVLDEALRDTLFAPESLNAPIQIAGPAESAGLSADAIWFLGAAEDSWPAVGPMHPLLPPEVQRQADMPHASPLGDWELSRVITNRLIASASTAHFSFARQRDGVESQPSRLVARLAGPPKPMIPEMLQSPLAPPSVTLFSDVSRVPFRQATAHGGSRVLSSQSQCPFKAFASERLGAEDWKPAEVGLTPQQRGQILHAILRSVWSGPPDGISSHDGLISLPDRAAFIKRHVERAIQTEVPASTLDRMPPRYLDLEEIRLVRLVSEWLKYEAERVPFSVAGTEVDRTVSLAGLTLKLRIDRIDHLNDGSLLVIDYKTGDVSRKAWDIPRPENVQLPLYAAFGIDENPGGLVFAKLRSFDREFVGNVADARATLLGNLTKANPLLKYPLTPEMLCDWKSHIEELARDFVAGRSDVDPRDYPKTCERCGLQTICRIHEPENRSRIESWNDSMDEETGDE